MHDRAPHTRHTHATNTKYIYSMPERALMSTVTILVHPSKAQRHSTCSLPDCDLRIRLTEGESVIKGRREEMTRATAAPRMQPNHAAVFRTKRGTEVNTGGPATQTASSAVPNLSPPVCNPLQC